jgi:hypothetical protein
MERDMSARTAMLERPQVATTPQKTTRPLQVVIAGGGIGGLVLAVGLLKKGVDVAVYERDLTAIRGEGKYRGPIQVRRCCCHSWLCCYWVVAAGVGVSECRSPSCMHQQTVSMPS